MEAKHLPHKPICAICSKPSLDGESLCKKCFSEIMGKTMSWGEDDYQKNFVCSLSKSESSKTSIHL